MTRIKLCGLSRPCDIETANTLRPDCVGFVFAPESRRYVTHSRAADLKALLDPGIHSAGVFVDQEIESIARLLHEGVIDLVQLHGNEDNEYIRALRSSIKNLQGMQDNNPRPHVRILQAFRIRSPEDVAAAQESAADLVLLDAGAGDGKTFDWSLLRDFRRPFFLAGGLTPENAADAVRALHPYGVDVSSGIETDGFKDPEKMAAFVRAVRSVSEGQSL